MNLFNGIILLIHQILLFIYHANETLFNPFTLIDSKRIYYLEYIFFEI